MIMCAHCWEPVERTPEGQGFDTTEYPWSHISRFDDGTVIANPKCDNGHETSGGGWDDGTWAEPGKDIL